MLEKLIEINHEWNAETPKFGSDVLLSASSQMGTEEEVVLDIQSQLKNMEVKTLIFFASSAFKQDRLSRLMKKAFNNSVVFGCSSTGERYNDRMLRNSLVALALSLS